jgi:stage III sporulation protein AH
MTSGKIFGKQGFFAKIGKRNYLIIAAVLLIGVAVYLNYVWFFNPTGNIGYGDNNMGDQYSDQTDAGTQKEESYFTSAQLSREKARDEALEVLQTVVNSEDALQETKDAALSDISRIALEIEKEANIEQLVRARGFEECIAVISGDSASVIVRSDAELLGSHVAQISEIVYEQAGILPTNLKILCK